MAVFGMGGRKLAESILYGFPPGTVVPPHWPWRPWTSAERRWSELVRIKMRSHVPHPRPWEGPQTSFDGIGWSFGVGRWSLAGTEIDASALSIREALERLP